MNSRKKRKALDEQIKALEKREYTVGKARVVYEPKHGYTVKVSAWNGLTFPVVGKADTREQCIALINQTANDLQTVLQKAFGEEK